MLPPKCNEVSALENQGPWLQGVIFPIQHLSHSKVTWGCSTLLTVGETEAGMVQGQLCSAVPRLDVAQALSQPE